MAGSLEEDTDYESDPEEAKRALTMRRREASDDEEENNYRDGPVSRIASRSGIDSDEDSIGRADYDEEESQMADDEEELDEEYEVGETKGGVELEVGAVMVVDRELVAGRDGAAGQSMESEGLNNVEEGKKEFEPFAVPTAGAFYMHDDRFRGSNGGRNRRMFGGKRLWESKDDKKWGHDKFEEITLQERHYEEARRNSRGRRGRGNNRGPGRGYPSGNKSKGYNNNSQSLGPKDVRGRGPRRYEPSKVTYIEAYPTQEKRRSGKVSEQTSHTTSGRTFASVSNSEYAPVPPARKQSSSLNIASPPFYPSGSSSNEPASMQRRDAHAGAINLNVRSSVLNENVLTSQSNSMVRGKNVADFIGMERLYINDSTPQNAGKRSTTQFSPGSSFVSATQPLQARAQGKVLTPSVHLSVQPGAPLGQVNRASPPPQFHNLQQSPAQNRTHSFLLAHQFGQLPGPESQDSSLPKAAVALKYSEPREMVSLPKSSKSEMLFAKENTSAQGSGRSSIPYGGAEVVEATSIGSGRSDRNFAATPAFLPAVMPFGGQHPGGMGVPAVGMAFPGYVAQPHLGLGSSEMTWLPVLASPAGALGATYGSPCIAFDGAYHSRPPGQTSTSGVPSKGNNANKPINDWKPSQGTELANDGSGQRQKNTRRYTEMNFGQ